MAPIESVELKKLEQDPLNANLIVVSGGLNSCESFKGYQLDREGETFVVKVTNTTNAATGVPCTTIYGTTKSIIPKQVWSLKTRVPNGGFTADYPKRNLAKLGFDVEEFGSLPPRPQPAGSPRPPVSGTKTIVDKGVGRFAVTLETDKDGYITASCPALGGCHSQGRTQQEALVNIRGAIRGYLASMRKHEEKIPEAHWEGVEVAI